MESRSSPVDAPDGTSEVGAVFLRVRRVNMILSAVVVAVTAVWLGPAALAVAAAIVAAAYVQSFLPPFRRPAVVLFADAAAIGLTVFVVGPWPTFMAAATAYLMTVAMLLLDRLRAAALFVGASAFFVAVHFYNLGLFPGARQTPAANYLVALLLLQITAVVQFYGVQTMRRVWAREKELRAEERKASEMKTEFVSMVSHELRTPLTSIAGFTSTLQETWQDLEPAEIDEFLSIVGEQAEHLARLVEDILVIPRLDAGRVRLDPQVVDIRTMAGRLVEVFFPEQEGRQAALVISRPVTAWADPVRVQQVLRNLLDNARKYGGDQVVVEATARERDVVVTVSDNGPGIHLEDRERIFEPFEQLSTGDARTDSGIGLGLPIARRMARAMGGDLVLEEVFPRGSRFVFTLPAHAPGRPQAATEPMRKSA